jgi:uncharacterized membrane protein
MQITRLDAHHKFYISFVAALIIFAISYAKISASTQFIITWTGFAFILTSLSWSTIISVHPLEMKKLAKLQDSNRTLIFVFVLSAALVCLFVVVLLLRSTQHLSGIHLTLHIVLSVAAVISSWALVHTLFVFRYAHLYYESAADGKAPDQYEEGLEFPKEKEPDYIDFAYFSFVIGMTFQVSDVEISSKRIRRLTLIHSLIAFAFNTVIVALSINVISGMMTK